MKAKESTDRKKADSIAIPPLTQNRIRQQYQLIEDAKARLSLIVSTLIEASGGDGDYVLSRDFTALIPSAEAGKEGSS